MVKNSSTNAGNIRKLDSVAGNVRDLEEGRGIHSRIFAWRIPVDKGAWQAPVHGVTKRWK